MYNHISILKFVESVMLLTRASEYALLALILLAEEQDPMGAVYFQSLPVGKVLAQW